MAGMHPSATEAALEGQRIGPLQLRVAAICMSSVGIMVGVLASLASLMPLVVSSPACVCATAILGLAALRSVTGAWHVPEFNEFRIIQSGGKRASVSDMRLPLAARTRPCLASSS